MTADDFKSVLVDELKKKQNYAIQSDDRKEKLELYNLNQAENMLSSIKISKEFMELNLSGEVYERIARKIEAGMLDITELASGKNDSYISSIVKESEVEIMKTPIYEKAVEMRLSNNTNIHSQKENVSDIDSALANYTNLTKAERDKVDKLINDAFDDTWSNLPKELQERLRGFKEDVDKARKKQEELGELENLSSIPKRNLTKTQKERLEELINKYPELGSDSSKIPQEKERIAQYIAEAANITRAYGILYNLNRDIPISSEDEEFLKEFEQNHSELCTNGSLNEQKLLNATKSESNKAQEENESKLAKIKASFKEIKSKLANRNNFGKNNVYINPYDEQTSTFSFQEFGFTETPNITYEHSQTMNKPNEENFSKEEISEALSKYREYISEYENIDEETILQLKSATNEDISFTIQDDFNGLLLEDKISSRIAQVLGKLAENTFNGNIKNILIEEQARENFLRQLDQAIEKGIMPDKEMISIGEFDQNLEKYFQENAVDMDVSAIETKQEHTQEETQQTIQEEQPAPKEMYSFINSEYLQQDSVEGLVPRNGANSKSVQDDKKSIFYSEGKEGAIVMYFEFLRKYIEFSGALGDKLLQEYADYQIGLTELSEKSAQQLESQVAEIKQIRSSQTFDEHMGDKLYLQLSGIDKITDKKEADMWRKAHPGTRMEYNYANGWTSSVISPDRIDVVTLQSRDGTDTRISQKDMIMYFLSQTRIEDIEALGVNDTTLEYIKAFSQEHSEEIAKLGAEYSIVTQNIQEYEQSRKSNEPAQTSVESENIEKTAQSTAIAKPDNSFIGKVKRVFANMKDMKNKDNSKGFLARLGSSIQTVFGNKKEEEYYEELEDKTEQTITSNTTKIEQPRTLEEQLKQGVDLSKFNQKPQPYVSEEKSSQRDKEQEEVDLTQ